MYICMCTCMHVHSQRVQLSLCYLRNPQNGDIGTPLNLSSRYLPYTIHHIVHTIYHIRCVTGTLSGTTALLQAGGSCLPPRCGIERVAARPGPSRRSASPRSPCRESTRVPLKGLHRVDGRHMYMYIYTYLCVYI